MSDVLSPTAVEKLIQETRGRIHDGVKVVSNARKAYTDAKRKYDQAFAQAFLDYEGPQTEKKYAAELATSDERYDMEIKYLALKHAESLAQTLANDLSALQSISKSVLAMYGSERGFGG